MYSFWHVRGHLSEGRKWLEEAADESWNVTHSSARTPRPAADLARLQGDLESATALAESSLDIARRHRDPTLTGFALSTLASIAGEKAEFVRAAALLEEAIPELRRADDRRGLAIATSNLGYVALTMGDLERAAALFEEGLDLQRETGDAASAALILLNLGLVSLRRNRPARAADVYGECLRLSARLGHREYVAYAEDGLAALAVREGRMGRALVSSLPPQYCEGHGIEPDPASASCTSRPGSRPQRVRPGDDRGGLRAARALTLDEAVACAISTMRDELREQPCDRPAVQSTQPANEFNDENLFVIGIVPEGREDQCQPRPLQGACDHMKKEIERIIATRSSTSVTSETSALANGLGAFR
jgi:tetratricopeptide (TPR) repeat protein